MPPVRSTTSSTRETILDAALAVMREHGLAGATTKQIARASGFSEASLYKHFADKTALFVAVLLERVPSRLSDVLHGLPDRLGTGSLEETLGEVAREALAFYRETFPMGASLFSEPALLAAHRAALDRLGTGPHVGVETLAAYLAAERGAGRVRADADPRACALLLLGACQMEAFLAAFGDRDPDRAVAAAVARTVSHALTP